MKQHSRSRTNWMLAVAAAVLALTASAQPVLSQTTPTFGQIPEEAWMEDGTFDAELMPDFVSALDRDGNIAGYVSAQDLMDENRAGEVPLPVIDTEFNLVGHMVPGRGFVPIGTPYDSVDKFPITLYQGQDDGTVEVTHINP